MENAVSTSDWLIWNLSYLDCMVINLYVYLSINQRIYQSIEK